MQTGGRITRFTVHGSLTVIECFVSYLMPTQKNEYYCRCSLGQLSEDEIDCFERRSGIKNHPDYVLHRGISLETKNEQYEHDELLEQFRLDIAGSADNRERGVWCYYHDFVSGVMLPAYWHRGGFEHVRIMTKFNGIAQKIHKLRKGKPEKVEQIESGSGNYPSQTQAATGVGVSGIVKAYEASIEKSDGTPANVRDNDAIDAINKNTDAMNEQTAFMKESLLKSIPIHFSEESESPSREDIPDFAKDGFFETQREFANRTGYAMDSLNRHRETNRGMVWLNEEKTLGMSEVKHFFQKTSNKSNSPYKYFVYHDAEKNDRFMKTS
jgi:hypothetical protein